MTEVISASQFRAEKAKKPNKYRFGPLHAKILEYLRCCYHVGATDEDMQNGIDMPANTQRPRRRELQLMGLIVDSGQTRLIHSRRQAVVWLLAPAAP